MKRSILAPILAALLTVTLLSLSLGGGIGTFFGDDDDTERVLPPADDPSDDDIRVEFPDFPAPPPAVNGVSVIYEDLWLVEEGQWWLGNGETYGLGDGLVSYRRLLESDGTEGVVITAPGADGKYRARVELHETAPVVPTWCEDVEEASVHMDADPSALQMGSFETFSDPVGIPSGWYRVRYCTEKQDVAAEQDAFVGEDYATYAGRHLIQIWKAPRQPDRTLRLGSRWARQLAQG